MTIRLIVPMALFLVASVCGCSREPPAQVNNDNKAPAAVAGDQKLLDPLVLTQKPEKVITVREARTRKAGETVVVSGKIPPEKVKPFNSAVAAFVMVTPEDMDKEEVKEEFDCDDAAMCPRCKKLLDQLAVQVEVVDKSGAPVPATLEGFRGLKPGGVITVEGTIQHYGKDNKQVRIVATKFYPG